MSLSPNEVAQIVAAVISALDERRSITPEQHDSDHRLVQEMAEERRERAELWREMRKMVVKYGAVGAISALGTMAWYFITHAFVGKVP